jgi:sugar O-acyltransferase (sialic acid O-acetyltransferase NeuD family)
MKNIVLFGGGNHVSYCIDIIERGNKYSIIGITDPFLEIGTIIMGYKIIGRQEDIKELINNYGIQAGLITIGDNWIRKIVHDIIINIVPDFEFVSSIHPSVIIGKNVKIGKGTVIMAGCIISPNVVIGEFCFFATGAILEHDSIMGDFSSLSAGSITGGKVIIGKYSAITLGVILFDRISIGEHTIIGSGSLVTNDIPSYVIAYGSPAKVIRERKIGEKYLK